MFSHLVIGTMLAAFALGVMLAFVVPSWLLIVVQSLIIITMGSCCFKKRR